MAGRLPARFDTPEPMKAAGQGGGVDTAEIGGVRDFLGNMGAGEYGAQQWELEGEVHARESWMVHAV